MDGDAAEVKHDLETDPTEGRVQSTFIGPFFLIVIGFWVVVGQFVFLTNQEENVLTSSWQRAVRPTVQAIAPEQWGFFTKSPRDESLVPYGYDAANGWVKDALFPHGQVQNAFGLNRVSRAQGIELGLLYTEAVGEDWIQCDDSSATAIECLDSLSTEKTESWLQIVNASPSPTICGLGALAREVPAPWAYARIGQTGASPRVLLIDVTC
ncbi:MAG: SdpA family antimicrobial peptide system protein [Rhodoglobus sp.]